MKSIFQEFLFLKSFQEKRLQLCQKIQDERTSCINLRVQIRLEQERIQRRRNNKK